MNYLITVNNERMNKGSNIKLFTGNIGTYTFSFDFDEHWQGLLKFASFTNDTDTFIVQLENDTVTVPSGILETPGICSFGVFGTNAEDGIKRISTNLFEFEVTKGAYLKGVSPHPPTPDIWESMFRNSIPKIIDGYWHLYEIDENKFVKTDIRAIGQLPIKGIDYFTKDDKTELVSSIEKQMLGDIEACLDNIIDIQNGIIGGDSV